MKNKSKHKKRDTDKMLTIGIVSVLFVICSVSYIHQKIMLKEYGVTTCVVVDRRKKPGKAFYGYLAEIEYYVNNKQYTHEFPNSSDNYKIGDKFRIKYSIEDPNICEVLWDERIMEDSISVRDGKELSQ